MDDVYRTNALIANQPTRYSWSPHLNHRLAPEVAVTMPLWLDQHLKAGPALPETPQSELQLKSSDGGPVLRVTPDSRRLPVARCEIFFSVDPDPRARFWRSADVLREGESFHAALPLHTLDLPLFAFANIYHTLPKPESLAALRGLSKPVSEVCLSSLLHSVSAAELKAAAPSLTTRPGALVDDFAHGQRDWYVLNAGNLTHQQLWIRKVTDPLYRGPDGASLLLTLRMPETNRLTIVLQQNEWRSYRGPRRTFTCTREIPGSAAPQTLSLRLADFASPDGSPSTWSEVDQLGLCANFGRPAAEAKPWIGPAAEFLRVEWV